MPWYPGCWIRDYARRVLAGRVVQGPRQGRWTLWTVFGDRGRPERPTPQSANAAVSMPTPRSDYRRRRPVVVICRRADSKGFIARAWRHTAKGTIRRLGCPARSGRPPAGWSHGAVGRRRAQGRRRAPPMAKRRTHVETAKGRRVNERPGPASAPCAPMNKCCAGGRGERGRVASS